MFYARVRTFHIHIHVLKTSRTNDVDANVDVNDNDAHAKSNVRGGDGGGDNPYTCESADREQSRLESQKIKNPKQEGT